MKKTEIKPCPFCGAMPELGKVDLTDRRRFYYGCTNERCLIQPTTAGYTNQVHAIKSWNRRDGVDD